MLLRFFALACFALSLAVFWLLPPEPLVRLSPCQALAGWSSDGTKLTVVGLPVGGAWQVQQWDLQNGRLVNSLPLPAHEFQSDNPACFSEIVAGGALLANGRSSLGDHSTSPLRVWNLEQRKFWREFQTTGGDYFVRPVAFSADGGWMAIQVPSDQNQPSIDLWRVSEDRRISTIAGFHAPLALSADGRWLAATDDLHQVGLFNAETGEQVERTKAHTFPVGSLAFSPDGRWLASAANGANRSEDSRPAEVSLHEVPQLRTAVSWNLPGSTSGKLEFTPDGRFLSARDAVFGSKATW
ncbi:MAG: hypothetical protein NT069_13085, partial [Planctomycetota bacterium]|nr:hypothetical protein [Planctomycetota bacterium]